MDKIQNPILEPLLNDISDAIDLYSFASSNDLVRYLTKQNALIAFNSIYQQLDNENRVIYVGVDRDLKKDAFLILIDNIYSNNKIEVFYQALLEIFEVYEEWFGKKIFIKNILKDLELLPKFENYKNEFMAIGVLEKESQQPQQQKHEQSKSKNKPDNKKIFIVHGHDNEMKETVARTLQNLDLNPIILNELPNRSMTVIEKFEKYSDEVGYAVVLLSPDDLGNVKSKKDELNFRARQNVIFELGYFIAKLGRSKVCALHKDEVEILSDISGVLYTKFEGKGWKLELADELIAAGYIIDKNKL